MKANRPDGWRGVRAREQAVKGTLCGVLGDEAEVERIYNIIWQHGEY